MLHPHPFKGATGLHQAGMACENSKRCDSGFLQFLLCYAEELRLHDLILQHDKKKGVAP